MAGFSFRGKTAYSPSYSLYLYKFHTYQRHFLSEIIMIKYGNISK